MIEQNTLACLQSSTSIHTATQLPERACQSYNCGPCCIRVRDDGDDTCSVSLVDVIIALDHIRVRLEERSHGRAPCKTLSGKAHDAAFPVFVPEEDLVDTLRPLAGEPGLIFLTWYHELVRRLPNLYAPSELEKLTEEEEDALIEKAHEILRARLSATKRSI